MDNRRIALTFKENGQNGGPFISHKRILNSSLKNKYDFIPLTIPRAHTLITPKGMKRFVDEIRDSNIDAVQIAGLQLDGILTMYACKKARVKTIVAVHGRVLESPSVKGIWKVLYAIGEKWTIDSADAAFGVSDYVSSWKICKEAPHYFGTIYNLPPQIKKLDKDDRLKTRKRLGLEEEDVVFISTGRIFKEKGFDTLWEAIQKVDSRLPIKFLIVGDGAYLQQWRNEVRNAGLERRIIFLGYKESVDEFLNASDAFIICSKHETLCISLLEAGMYGLPLVGTKVGGIPEIINDQNGILVESEDVAGFANAITFLAGDHKKREEYGKAALEYISTKFNKAEILNRLGQLYETVLKNEVL